MQSDLRATRRANTVKTLRWTAKIASLLSIGVLVLFAVGEPGDPSLITREQLVGLAFFPIGLVLGLIIAWWKEVAGAVVALASVSAFYLVYGALLGNNVSSWAFLIFAIPAFLFLLDWIISKNKLREVTS
jgi:hypothetical protein